MASVVDSGIESNHPDLAGQVTASRDTMGRWTTYSYNAVGEQITSTDNLGHTTTSAYDLASCAYSTTKEFTAKAIAATAPAGLLNSRTPNR